MLRIPSSKAIAAIVNPVRPPMREDEDGPGNGYAKASDRAI
ncbi:MAG: hypothetical protein VX166_10555 [Pseudomonadota bacterium]|nr:hypothetical protein [Gammaproteobacteria bacterium]MEC7079923.1 hypothetical protein [Pseudomonadota bacterium]MEC7581299.1 hypothetical protein [Pseudomonadota bacterium]MEC7605541.1 hypothetical protein [Pseudomonadota bacterium]MEC7893286.1 hypothetical protein [Pseudomonadota bacterium]